MRITRTIESVSNRRVYRQVCILLIFGNRNRRFNVTSRARNEKWLSNGRGNFYRPDSANIPHYNLTIYNRTRVDSFIYTIISPIMY